MPLVEALTMWSSHLLTISDCCSFCKSSPASSTYERLAAALESWCRTCTGQLEEQGVQEGFARQRHAWLAATFESNFRAQQNTTLNMSLGRDERFVQADVRGRKKVIFMHNLFYCILRKLRTQVPHFPGAGHFVVRKKKSF